MGKLNLYPQIDKNFLEVLKLEFNREYYFYDNEGNKVSISEKHIHNIEDQEIYELVDENA